MRLPPPDPNELMLSEPEGDVSFGAPTIVFTAGPPGRSAERLAEALLQARPGLLFLTTGP